VLLDFYVDRSAYLGVAWAKIAPRIGAEFALAPGFQRDLLPWQVDNAVRAAVGADSDRQAREKLLERIERWKAGTLVGLEIKATLCEQSLGVLEGADVVREILIGIVGKKWGPWAEQIARYVGEGSTQAMENLVREYRQEITDRIARRDSTSASSSSRFTSTDDRPAAFGSKN
jgi:hypothetical protein